jgi:hypothetical protein
MRTPFAMRFALLLLALALPYAAWQAEEEEAIERDYRSAPAAPSFQTTQEADAKSAGCISCHSASDQKTMHRTDAVILGCTDCHGGNSQVMAPAGEAYMAPRHGGANRMGSPFRTWRRTISKERPQFIRFINPGDLRVARESCGACHLPIVQASERSLMATSAMLWGGAAYNNGILPFKRYILGEAYIRARASRRRSRTRCR